MRGTRMPSRGGTLCVTERLDCRLERCFLPALAAPPMLARLFRTRSSSSNRVTLVCVVCLPFGVEEEVGACGAKSGRVVGRVIEANEPCAQENTKR